MKEDFNIGPEEEKVIQVKTFKDQVKKKVEKTVEFKKNQPREILKDQD